MPKTMRVALVAALFACLALVAASPASAFRSPKGAKPTVKVLTKNQPAAAKAKRIRLRVTVGTRSRVRLRVLAIGIAKRPVFAVSERKIRFAAGSGRIVDLKLTPAARRGIAAATAACRDVQITAFASGRQLTRRGDNPRTTLVRHSKTLKHRRKSGCTVPGTGSAPGLPGSPGSPPSLGGPGLDPPGTPPRGTPPVPTDPISIRAGAADADASPPVGTPMFAYTSRSLIFSPQPDHFLQILADPDENLYAKTFVPSQGIHTRIRARAIVIEAGGKKYALAMVDLGGHPYAFNQAVASRIADTGISHERLFLSSTHTHSSSGAIWSADNSGYAFVGGDAYDPRVFEMVVSGVTEAIREAHKRLQPARLGVGSANLKGASSNREHDAFKLNPDAPAHEKSDNHEAVDQRVTTIRVDAANGAPLGVWSNFAVHPTSLGGDNLLFSGDNVATAERLVEEEMIRDAAGLPLPGRPVNVWTNGTEGDVTEDDDVERDPGLPGNDPHSRLQHQTGGFSGANSSGRKIASGIVRSWRDAGTKMSGSPALDVRRTFMEFDGSEGTAPFPVLGAGGIVTPNEGSAPFPEGGCGPTPHPVPGQGNKMHLFGGPGVAPSSHPVSLMRVGPLAIAAYPTEIGTTAGRRIKSSIAATAGAEAPAGVIIAGLTNSYNSYLATPEEYDYCSYFGSFTLWGREQLSLYRRTGDELAKSLFGGAALPARSEPSTPSPGTPNQPSIRPTPDAGKVVAQPAATVKRLGQAVFRFNGGDPAIDAPRGRSFVSLEFDPDGGDDKFTKVADEDSVMDTTAHASDDSWTETWQFAECEATDGRYRFHVRGKANKGDGQVSDYEAFSRTFRLEKASIKSYSTTVSDGRVRVRAEYQGLPASALATLPRRVRHGFAVVRVTRPGGTVEDVFAFPDSNGLEFTASVPNGSTASTVLVQDGCGNTGS